MMNDTAVAVVTYLIYIMWHCHKKLKSH